MDDRHGFIRLLWTALLVGVWLTLILMLFSGLVLWLEGVPQ